MRRVTGGPAVEADSMRVARIRFPGLREQSVLLDLLVHSMHGRLQTMWRPWKASGQMALPMVWTVVLLHSLRESPEGVLCGSQVSCEV